MKGPYRTALGKTDTSATFACELADGDKHRWVRRVYVKVFFTFVIAALLRTGGGVTSLLVLAVGLSWALLDYLHRKSPTISIRIDGEKVRVFRPDLEPLTLDIDKLHDVRLDTKAASKNVTMARADGVNTVFGMRSNHNIDVDISRIELVTDDEPVLLATDYINASLCTESLRGIRLFLRAHGWKPLDER